MDPEIVGDPLATVEAIVDRLDPPSQRFSSIGGTVRIVSAAALVILIGVWVIFRFVGKKS